MSKNKGFSDVHHFIAQIRERAKLWGNPKVTIEGTDVLCEFKTQYTVEKGRIMMQTPDKAEKMVQRLRSLFPMHETHQGENRPAA